MRRLPWVAIAIVICIAALLGAITAWLINPYSRELSSGTPALAPAVAPSRVARDSLATGEPVLRPSDIASVTSSATAIVHSTAIAGISSSSPPSPGTDPTGVPAIPTATAMPKPVPTKPPAATRTLAPTHPAPTSTPDPAQLLRRAVAAEQALRTGRLEATLAYTDGSKATVAILFDLGDEKHVQRFHSTAVYHGSNGAQTTERITIGDQSWQRRSAGTWTAFAAQESVQGELRTFLPHTDTALNPAVKRQPEADLLSWYDRDQDADITLTVYPDTGIPRQLVRLTRATGLALTVTYTGWNEPIEIAPPKA